MNGSLKLQLTTLAILACTPAFGEGRDDKQQNAVNRSEETTKKGLDPNKQQHIQKAMEHLKNAEEARQQKNEGRAQQEERMAMDEQQKAQQLQKQIEENKKVEDQNQAGANKLREGDPIDPVKLKGADNAVVSLRDPNYNSQKPPDTFSSSPSSSGKDKPAEPEYNQVPKEQLANLGAADISVAASRAAGDEFVPPTGDPGKDSSRRIEWNESASFSAPASPANIAAVGGPRGIGGSGASGGSIGGGGAPMIASSSSGGGSGGGGGDFWKKIGEDVQSQNEDADAAEEKLTLKTLRAIEGKEGEGAQAKGGLPDATLSDEAFWKKVGKEPKKCSLAKTKTKRERQSCLSAARRSLVDKHKETKREPVSEPAKPVTAQPVTAQNSVPAAATALPPASP